MNTSHEDRLADRLAADDTADQRDLTSFEVSSLCDGEDEHRCLAGIARCEHEVKVDAELASVAKRMLNIPTLETRRSDALDFHEVSVGQLLAALRLTYRMGRKDGWQ